MSFLSCMPYDAGDDIGDDTGKDDKTVKLSAPSILAVSDGILTWSPVPGSNGYTLDINGNTQKAETALYNISDLSAGDYVFKVRADAPEGQQSSDFSEPFEYTVPQPDDPEPKIYTTAEFQEQFMTFTKKIPKIYINTNGAAITSKVDYVDAVVDIESDISEYNLSGWQVQIRGRGNSSWSMDKKPYRIKANKKTSVFGMQPVKNWALIANHSDKSLMRNYLAYMLGRSMEGMDYNPNSIYTEVYLNNSYDGLYCMTDQNESGSSRADIEGYTTTNGVLTDLGFFVEIDDRADHLEEGNVLGRDYFMITNYKAQWRNTYKFVLKYPKYDDDGFADNPELFSQAFNYIKSYVTEVSDAIFDSDRQKFLELCDEASFIDFFAAHELFKNTDAHSLSLFFSRKQGGKLKMNPLWDFDISAGNTEYIGENWNGGGFEAAATIGPESWYVVRINDWFRALMERDADFRTNFAARYKHLYASQIKCMLESISDIAADIKPAAERNFGRWAIMGSYVWPNPYPVIQANTFDLQVAYLKNFLTERALWLLNNVDYPVR